MAFVPGFFHDVFISYSHADNEGGDPWVTAFYRDLELRLKEIASRNATIFFDPGLQRNANFDRQIKTAVESSAVLLAVLTENYLLSNYCQDEREWFYDNLQTGWVEDRRVSLVLPDPIETEKKPQRFAKVLGREFFKTPREARFPVRLSRAHVDPECQKAYAFALNDLAWEIEAVLQDLQRIVQGVGPNKPRPQVFVAEVTEDLDDRRDDLCRYLKQAGFGIVPFREHDRRDIAAYRAEVGMDMASAVAFVQLLTAVPGRRPEGVPEGFPRLQYDIASARGLPVYQWKPEGLVVPSDLPQAHAALLGGASVKACGIETFKAWLVERLKAPPKQPDTKNTDKQGVYITYDKPDRRLADDAAEVLFGEGFDVDLSLDEGSADEIRQDLTDGMLSCDGLLVVYGHTKPSWIKGQYREGRKILAQRPSRARALALVNGPPPDKPDVGIRSDSWRVLEARQGITPTTLKPFIDDLRGPA